MSDSSDSEYHDSVADPFQQYEDEVGVSEKIEFRAHSGSHIEESLRPLWNASMPAYRAS